MVFVCILLMDIYGPDLHSLAFGLRITSLILSCHVSLLVNAFMPLQYLLISMVKAITATSNFSKLILPSVLIGKGLVSFYLLISMVKTITAASNFLNLILPCVLIGKCFYVSTVFIDIYGLDLHSLAFGRRITSQILSCHVSSLVYGFITIIFINIYRQGQHCLGLELGLISPS
jgi:hypothetical protein